MELNFIEDEILDNQLSQNITEENPNSILITKNEDQNKDQEKTQSSEKLPKKETITQQTPEKTLQDNEKSENTNQNQTPLELKTPLKTEINSTNNIPEKISSEEKTNNEDKDKQIYLPKITINNNSEIPMNDQKKLELLATEGNANNENKLNNSDIILENQNRKNTKKHCSQSVKKKNPSNKLNNIPPEVYMRKRITPSDLTLNYSYEPKFKKIEEYLQMQCDYDFNRVMQEMKIKYENKKKLLKQQKLILEEEKKYREKIKNMQEFQSNILNQRIEKILKKQKSFNNKNKSKTIENQKLSRKRLAKIQKNNPNLCKLKVKQDEDEFILNVEEKIKNSEMLHKYNHNRQLNLINDKINENKEKYNLRNEKCIQYETEKKAAIEKNFLDKDMMQRYNTKQTILHERSLKELKYKNAIKKNLESFQEKQEILEQKEKDKIKKLLNKINKKSVVTSNSNIQNSNKQRQRFLELQKKNYIDAQKELDLKYEYLMEKQEDIVNFCNDIQKDDEYLKKVIMKNSKESKDEMNKDINEMNSFIDKIKKESIVNQNPKTIMKVYKSQVKKELEEKNKKAEEALEKLMK